jgi:oligosaccharide repeat unit polymerase
MNRLLGPRWVLPVYWMVFLGATVIFHPSSKLDGRSAFIIATFCTVFLLGATYATMKGPAGPRQSKLLPTPEPVRAVPALSTATIRFAIAFGSLANMAAALLALRSSPYGLGEILTLQGLAGSTNSLAVARNEGEGVNLMVFLFLGFGYVAALVAPFIKLTDSKRQVWWAVLPAITSLAYAAVSSARLGFLVSAALTAGGFIACAVVRNGVAPGVKFKTAVGVTLIGAILASAFIGIGVLRIGRVDAAAFQATLNKQSSYTVGTVGAFSTWYGEYDTGMGQQPGYGTATIAGMEYLTEQDRALTRAYGEFAIIDDNGRKSNVYTAFRGLLLDFGIDGTIIFLGIGGFIFGWLYLRAARGSVVAATLLGYGYASILFSGWMATTTFTNILVVAVAAPAVLLFAKQRFLALEKRRAEELRRCGRLSPVRSYLRNG